MHYTFILYEVLFKQKSIMEKVEIRLENGFWSYVYMCV